MTQHQDIRDDLEAPVDDELVRLAIRLTDSRPVPAAAFRGDLGRHLAAKGRGGISTTRIRALIGAYAVAGGALLSFGAISASGLGPLG